MKTLLLLWSSCLVVSKEHTKNTLWTLCPKSRRRDSMDRDTPGCHLQSFPASGSFPVSQLFTSDDQSVGVSASASVLPVNILGGFSLGLTGLISLQSKGLSRVFSSIPLEGITSSALSLFYCPALTSVHDYWKNHSFDYIDLCRKNNVSLFNTLSRFVNCFSSKEQASFMKSYNIVSWLIQVIDYVCVCVCLFYSLLSNSHVKWMCVTYFCSLILKITTRKWTRFLSFSCQGMFNSSGPHGLQHTRLPCASPSPRVCQSSCALKRWWTGLIKKKKKREKERKKVYSPHSWFFFKRK